MKIVKIIFWSGSILFLLAMSIPNSIILSYRNDILHRVDEVPETPIALVFGGGMKPDGAMSEMQEDRVKRGIELYEAGKVNKILMTGDDGTKRFDEVHSMHDYAVRLGVPDDDVHIDPAGFNTYQSCYRAKEIFRIDKAVVVSQTFHLPRILYFCRGLGIETTALSADLREYGLLGQLWVRTGREMLARVKAVLLMIQKPPSEVLGERQLLE